METIARINMLMGYFVADWFSNHTTMPEMKYHRLLDFCKNQVLMWDAGHRGMDITYTTATVLGQLDTHTK